MDQRGYTLQTLIVTAVVVAVIVTVLLIAITSNAGEDLAASDSDMEGRCVAPETKACSREGALAFLYFGGMSQFSVFVTQVARLAPAKTEET